MRKLIATVVAASALAVGGLVIHAGINGLDLDNFFAVATRGESGHSVDRAAGLLSGDPGGFPNGRILRDDVVDIEL